MLPLGAVQCLVDRFAWTVQPVYNATAIQLKTRACFLGKYAIWATWKYLNLNTPYVVGLVQKQARQVEKDKTGRRGPKKSSRQLNNDNAGQWYKNRGSRRWQRCWHLSHRWGRWREAARSSISPTTNHNHAHQYSFPRDGQPSLARISQFFSMFINGQWWLKWHRSTN